MEYLIFIKPDKDITCYVVTQREGKKVRIHEVYFTASIDCNKAADLSKEYNTNIRYDGTLFMEDGKTIRSNIENNIFIYRPKGKLSDRVLQQKEWIKNNILYRKDYQDLPEMVRFILLVTSYKMNEEENSIAVNVLSDISKYYRKIINSEEV